MTQTTKIYEDLQSIDLQLLNATKALEVIAERLEQGPDNGRPEGGACWFVVEGLREQRHKLMHQIDAVGELGRACRLNIVE